MHLLLSDLHWALRQIKTRGTSSLIIVLSLALGIGATTALWNVVLAVLVRPLPYADPERLVRVFAVNPSEGVEGSGLSAADALDYAAGLESLEGLELFNYWSFALTGDGPPQNVSAQTGTTGLLELLGRAPIAGRNFVADEGIRGRERVVVLSHGMWQRLFGGEEAIGRTLELDTRSYTVVGVMPPGFSFPPSGVEAWVPFGFRPERVSQERDRRAWTAIARLKPGVPLETAQDEADALAAALAEQYPASNEGWRLELQGFHEEMVAGVRPAFLVLFGGVVLMLLVTAANVVNLLLGRGLERQREMALRAAVGAGARQLTRLVLTESLLLTGLGALLGVGLAQAGIAFLVAAAPEGLPRLDEIGLDAEMLGFTLLVALLSGLGVGWLPALQARQADLAAALKDGGRGTAGERRRSRPQALVTAAEVAVAVLLLIGSGLLGRSFLKLAAVDPGFEAEGVLALQLFVFGDAYREPHQKAAFYERLTDELRTLPGVESVGMVSVLPMSPLGGFKTALLVDGRTEPEPRQPGVRLATGDFFTTLGIPLLQGRVFDDRDRAEVPPVGILNATAARLYFPGEDDPSGRRFDLGRTAEGAWLADVTVVGVVGDVRHEGLDTAPGPEVFVPMAQRPGGRMSVIARTSVEPETLFSAAQGAVWGIDPNQPLHRTLALEELIAGSLAQARFYAWLMALFAAVAVAVAVFGIYGVVSHAVSRRTQEIGVRLALGASGSQVVALVVTEVSLMVALGLAVGLLASAASSRLAASLFYGVGALDPLTFAAVPVGLLAVAITACAWPAWHAARLDPVQTLRYE